MLPNIEQKKSFTVNTEVESLVKTNLENFIKHFKSCHDKDLLILRIVLGLSNEEEKRTKIFQIEREILNLEIRIRDKKINFSAVFKEKKFLKTKFEKFKFPFKSPEKYPIKVRQFSLFYEYVRKIKKFCVGKELGVEAFDLEDLLEMIEKRRQFFDELKLSSMKDFSWMIFVENLEEEVLRIEKVTNNNIKLCDEYLSLLIDEWINIKNFDVLIST